LKVSSMTAKVSLEKQYDEDRPRRSKTVPLITCSLVICCPGKTKEEEIIDDGSSCDCFDLPEMTIAMADQMAGYTSLPQQWSERDGKSSDHRRGLFNNYPPWGQVSLLPYHRPPHWL
jgi:hypothetical protein